MSHTRATEIGYRHAPLLALLAWLLIDLNTTAFVSAMPMVLSELALSVSSITPPVVVTPLVIALLALPAGWLADRVPAQRLLIAALLLAAGGDVLRLATSNLISFTLASILDGMALAFLPPLAIVLLRFLARDLRGAAIGLMLALSVGGGIVYFLLSLELGDALGTSWRATSGVTLGLTVLLAILMASMLHAARPEADEESTLPAGSLRHLLIGTAVVMAFTGGVSNTLAVKAAALTEGGTYLARHYQNVLNLSATLSVIGALTVPFLLGRQLIWIPRLIAIAAVLALVGTVVGISSNDVPLSLYGFAIVPACGSLALGAVLSTLACWARAARRGSLTGIVLAFRQVPGMALGAALTQLDTSGFSWPLALISIALTAWTLWHVRACETAIRRVHPPAAPLTLPDRTGVDTPSG